MSIMSATTPSPNADQNYRTAESRHQPRTGELDAEQLDGVVRGQALGSGGVKASPPPVG